MAESKLTFYQRHPGLGNAAITIGLVGGLVGIIGGGAAIYQGKQEEKDLARLKKEIVEVYKPARDNMQGMGARMRMREQMPMYRMGMDLERMMGGDIKNLKPEARQKLQEFYQRNQEFMKQYNEMMKKYQGDFMSYRKEFREDMAKLRNDYLSKWQEPKEQGPARAIGEIQPPKLLKQVEPKYPEDARKAGVEGIVILEAQTDVKGHVANVKVLRSIPQLDQAATDAVKQWMYEPMVIKGKPTPVVFTVTVRFKLK